MARSREDNSEQSTRAVLTWVPDLPPGWHWPLGDTDTSSVLRAAHAAKTLAVLRRVHDGLCNLPTKGQQ